MENGPLTVHELFEIMIKEDREVFRNVDDISISLNKLREQKKWVSNREPKQVGKKSLLTWEITKAGQKSLENDAQDSEEIIDHVDPSENASSNSGAYSKTDLVECEEIIEIDDHLAFYDSACDSIRAMLETLLKKESVLKIKNKELKIRKLESFVAIAQIFNDADHELIGDIIKDLRRLEDATNE